MPLEFTITTQGVRALEVGVLPRMNYDEGLLTFIEVNQPVTFADIRDAFPTKSLRNDLAPQIHDFRRMGLIDQRRHR